MNLKKVGKLNERNNVFKYFKKPIEVIFCVGLCSAAAAAGPAAVNNGPSIEETQSYIDEVIHNGDKTDLHISWSTNYPYGRDDETYRVLEFKFISPCKASLHIGSTDVSTDSEKRREISRYEYIYNLDFSHLGIIFDNFEHSENRRKVVALLSSNYVKDIAIKTHDPDKPDSLWVDGKDDYAYFPATFQGIYQEKIMSAFGHLVEECSKRRPKELF